MKKVLFVVFLGLVFGCENLGDSGNVENSDDNKIEENSREKRVYYDNRDLKIHCFYETPNQEKVIKRIHYYQQNDGAGKKLEENYRSGKLHGTIKSWNSSGKITEEIKYKYGERDGLCKRWDNEGYLKATDLYKNGDTIISLKSSELYPKLDITQEEVDEIIKQAKEEKEEKIAEIEYKTKNAIELAACEEISKLRSQGWLQCDDWKSSIVGEWWDESRKSTFADDYTGFSECWCSDSSNQLGRSDMPQCIKGANNACNGNGKGCE
jgi:antitoxin component YwqK of YwqJK toxin-antitoxin module